MTKKIFSRIFLSFLCSIALVSYSEKLQIDFFMLLRNFIYIPDKIIENHSLDSLQVGIPYTASKEGYYINPWDASEVVADTAETILKKGCHSVNIKDINKLISFANYFIATAKIRYYNGLSFAVWPYPINWSYGLKPGWISGMAQGNIAVVLAGASLCSKVEDSSIYKKYAKLAINSFEVEVLNGGVLVKLDKGYWFEEYAKSEIKPPLVLNGHNQAIFSLGHLKKFDSRAEILFNLGIDAVEHNIHHYNAVTWSYYDRVGNPANNVYVQPLHARQMKELYELTGKDAFLKYHKIFYTQLFSPFSAIQRLALKPSRFLTCLLLVNASVLFVFWFLIDYLRLYLKKRVI